MSRTWKGGRTGRRAADTGEIVPRRCCFAEAIGARVAGCAMARKSTRQYRRTVDCADGEAHGHCAAWLDAVRRASRFAFGAPHSPGALPRAEAVRLQCGSLLGMRETLEDNATGRIQDVSGLMRRALARYESFERLPLSVVIKRVQHYEASDGQHP